MVIRTVQHSKRSNSYYIVIPPAFVELMGIIKGSKVDIRIDNQTLTVRKFKE